MVLPYFLVKKMEERKNYKDLNEAVVTMAKQIAKSLQYSETAFDKTFISVVQTVNENGTYDVLDDYGVVRNVVLALPNVTLSVGQRVYVTIPCGDLKKMYISGVHPQITNR